MDRKKNQVLSIEGMTCTNCALGVKKQLEKNGLENVEVNFVNGEARFVNPKNIDSGKIIDGITRLGYSVTNSEKVSTSRFDLLSSLLLICAILTTPLFAHMFLPQVGFLHNTYWQLAFATPVYAIGAWYFGRSAFRSLQVGVPNMDVLIFIGATAAYTYSLYGTLKFGDSHEGHQFLFYETAAMIFTLVILGNFLEKRSVKKTTNSIRQLQGLQKSSATVMRSSVWESVKITDFTVGDLVLVKSGEQIPVDGRVQKGSFSADESMLTGESEPIHKSEGDTVFSGSILLDGNAEIEMTKAIDNTALAKIIELVQNAQRDQPKIQKLGDRVSAFFVPIVIAISLLTFAVSFRILGIGFEASMLRSIAVLVISCPCAMGLATPTAVMVGIGRAAKNGILIKGGSTLEELAKTNVVVLDKTGTLTTGAFRVNRLTSSGMSDRDLKSILLGLEQHSNHPIAKSIARLWGEDIKPYPFQDVQELKGKGIRGVDEHGDTFFVGRDQSEYDLTVLKNGSFIGGLDIEDDFKKGADTLIQWLNEQNIRTILLSGDSDKKCRRLSQRLGISEYSAAQSPEDKINKIEMLAAKNKVVMIGDGINDAPALTRADVGISMGNASDISINSADVVLLKDNDLEVVKKAFEISRHTLLTVQQNLFWAFFYNVLAIPIAAAGFLSPAIAALSMAFSDVIVIGNSLRLRFKKL